MHFTTTALSFLAAASLAVAAPLDTRQDTANCPVVQEGDYVWKISKFYARKLDGKNISSIDFYIEATNKGTLNFQCAASGTSLGDGQLYKCGENSLISFAFQEDRNGLLIYQDVADDTQYVATTTVPNVCRAGGSGPNDYICQGVSDAYVTLVQYPSN